jgi:hypothetical protein
MAAPGLLQFKNQASTTLASTISSSATSISVAAGTGALFPTISNGQYFKITLNPASGSTPASEIMHVTAVSTDTFTVVRAQEGTTAQNWSSGSLVQNLITAGTTNSFGQVTQYAGNPNGNVAGYAATASNAPSQVWDTTNNLMWVCVTSGPAATAGWLAQAPLASPAFTGTPTAPTPASSDNSTRVATTAFVDSYAAPIAGNAGQVFAVAAASSASQAVNLGQFPASIASSGYQKFPNGLILQWGVSGTITTGSNLGYVSGSFPIAFPNNVFGAWGTPNNAGSSSWVALTVYASSLSTSGFTFTCDNASGGSHTITNSVNIVWFAIGN